METFKTMTCRKSVRSYKSTLSDANLQKILMALILYFGKYRSFKVFSKELAL